MDDTPFARVIPLWRLAVENGEEITLDPEAAGEVIRVLQRVEALRLASRREVLSLASIGECAEDLVVAAALLASSSAWERWS